MLGKGFSFSLSRPPDAEIRGQLDRQSKEDFSYPDVGASLEGAESLRARLDGRYVIDHYRARLGFGAEAFARARSALRRWEMFNLDWVELCWPTTRIEAGSTVGVLVTGPVVWSLNPCRIVQCIDDTGSTERFGFAYGTLPDHAAQGEEYFRVEWSRTDDVVWYEVLAFSRPQQILARLGYPYLRLMQKRFAGDSIRAMRRATRPFASTE